MQRRKGFLVALFSLCWFATPALAQTGNPMHDQFANMPEQNRRAELFRFITTGGNTCQALTAVYFAGLDGNRTAYWDNRCREGSLWRVSLPAQRNARPALTQCGAATGGVAAGPCFQPVGTAAAATAQTSGGRGTQLAGQGAAAPPGSRFGAIYATIAPLAAFGFANGNTDRLLVNTAAVRMCQGAAGRVACQFVEEIVNRCGALVQAVTRHPNAVAMTSDLSTIVLNRNFTGSGATTEAAEASAMEACRRVQGVTCRVAASGC
jgi:hypothetical protein